MNSVAFPVLSGCPPDDDDGGEDAAEDDGSFRCDVEPFVRAFFVGWSQVEVGSWSGGRLDCGFASGEAFFEGTDDGEIRAEWVR